jgi:hypothetical protein
MTDKSNIHQLRPATKLESDKTLTDSQRALLSLWENLGDEKKDQRGDQGGWKGDDSYKEWFAENKATMEAFVRSIRGEPGKDGKDGKDGEDGADGEDGLDGQDGKDGKPGADGADAYAVWAKTNKGTRTDYFRSLKGAPGEQGIPGQDGAQGPQGVAGEEGPPGKNGKDGLSAYQIWRKEGHKGTIKDFWAWLSRQAGQIRTGAGNFATIKGDKGDPGAQADPTRGIACIIDGGGSVIPAGLMRSLPIPFDCTIIGWTLIADVAGDLVIDLWRDTFANYPPTLADSITAAAKPTLAAANKGQMVTLAGWNTAIAAGDVLAVYVESASVITQATFSLIVTKSIV